MGFHVSFREGKVSRLARGQARYHALCLCYRATDRSVILTCGFLNGVCTGSLAICYEGFQKRVLGPAARMLRSIRQTLVRA